MVTRSECPPPAFTANPSGLGAIWGRLRTRGQRRALVLSTGLYSVVNLTSSTSSRDGWMKQRACKTKAGGKNGLAGSNVSSVSNTPATCPHTPRPEAC